MLRDQPELHVIGEIVGATDYELPSLFCKFSFEAGTNFRLLQGLPTGQTHCDMPPEGEMAILSHPVDVHYAVKGIDGWPRLRIEVYGVDRYGRIELAGYGCCIVPTTAGMHELRCHTWRPCGSMREQFSSAPRPPLAHDPPRFLLFPRARASVAVTRLSLTARASDRSSARSLLSRRRSAVEAP